MHYCIFSLIKYDNEILQYWIIINDIALMQMPDHCYEIYIIEPHHVLSEVDQMLIRYLQI